MRRTLARIARIATFAGAILVLGLALMGWALWRSGTVDRWIRTAIAERLGSDVHLTGARALWWPHPGIELDGVSLPAPGTGAVSAAVVRCRVSLPALIAGQIVPVTLQIDGLRLTFERAADGTWDTGGIERVLTAFSAPATDATAAEALPAVRLRGAAVALRDGSGQRPPLEIDDVRADMRPHGSGATVVLFGRLAGGGTVHADGALPSLEPPSFSGHVSLTRVPARTVLAWSPAAVAATASGTLRAAATVTAQYGGAVDARGSLELFDGEVAAADWQVHTPLRISGQALWDGADLRVEHAALDAARVAAAAAAADMVAATGAYRGRALHVDSATLHACGGTWRIAGNASSGPPARVDATLSASDIDGRLLDATLTALGVSVPLPHADAPLRLSATGTGTAGGAWSGHVTLATDGAVQWPPVRADGPVQIAADVAFDGGSVALTGGQGRVRRIAVANQTVDAVDAAFSYQNGALRVAPLRGSALGGTVSYSGTLPLGGRAPWRGQLDATHVGAASIADLADLAGEVDARAQLDGRGTDAITARAVIRLASDALTWGDARIAAPAEISATARLAGARRTLSNGRARAAQVSAGGLEAGNVSAAFSYSDATLAISSLRAHADGGSITAAATVPFPPSGAWSGSLEAQHIEVDPIFRSLGPRASGVRTEGAVADLSVHATGATGGRLHGSVAVHLAAGAVLRDELRVDAPAQAHGAFTIVDGTLKLTDVAATAARAAYGPLVATQATAALRYDADRLTFSDLRFHSCGGGWIDRGWFTLRDGGPFAGQLTITDATPGRLGEMLGDQEMTIPFARTDVDVTFTGRASADWMSTLRGTGSAKLTDGTVRSATVLQPIWEVLVGHGRPLEGATTHIAEISETFDLRGERFDTSDFLLKGDDYNATAAGSIGLDGSLDLTARIQLTAKGVQKMLVLGAVPLPTHALPGLPPIPAFVTGNLAGPTVRPDVAALPATTGRWLVDAVLHLPRGIGGAILDRLQQLWHGTARAVGLTAENPP